MQPEITVERVEPTAQDTRVSHVDQLSDRERDCLMRLSQDGYAGDEDGRTAATLSEYDVIKSTEYLRVVCTDARSRCNGVGINS